MTVTREKRDAPASEHLMRTAPFTLTRDDAGEPGDGLTLDGYATVFNQATVIDSWEGRFKEINLAGSWKRTLRATTPKLQFDHGQHPLIGSIPIGRITSIAEEATGPHVIARLTDNWLVEPVRDAIAEESIDGMSYRFSVVREEWQDKDGKVLKPDVVHSLLWASEDLPDEELMTRYLKEVKVSELGPVVWPAFEGTSVGVRSKVTIDLGCMSDPDQRRTLARAVFMADLAERGDDSPHQHHDDPQTTAGATGTPPSDDARDSTDAPTGAHPSPERAAHRQRVAALMSDRLELALRGATRNG